MNSKKITAKMISCMSKQSLKSNRMRNLFVMFAIVLASGLLTAILMFASGQKQRRKTNFPIGSRSAIIILPQSRRSG